MPISGKVDNKLTNRIRFCNKVDAIFLQILRDKYNVDIHPMDVQFRELRDKYKDDFEVAKKQAEKELGYKEEYLE